MNTYNSFKVAVLAASIALAMGSTSVMATAPTATQLPGAGAVASGAATGGTITTGTQVITFTGHTVINWGVASGATINTTGQPGGFNIGSGANLSFTDSASVNSSVLNVDVSGNASQIFGALSMNAGGGNLFVANSNGIIVGANASISGPAAVGLIANTRITSVFNGTAASIEYQGAGGDVSVAKTANISGTSVLVSGGGVVNVDLSAFTSGALTLNAGVKNSSNSLASDNTGATLTAAGSLGSATLAATNGFASAGNASSSGTTLTLDSNARVDGTLTNTGTMVLGTGFLIKGAVVNSKTMTQSGNASMGSLTNNGTYDGGSGIVPDHTLTTTAGGLINNTLMSNMGSVSLTGGDFVNNSQFTGTNHGLDTNGGGNVTNNGQVTGLGFVNINKGGNFTNVGTMAVGGSVHVVNGSITNSGALSVNGTLRTSSNNTTAGYTAGADYSVTNTGTLTSTGDLTLSANSHYAGDHVGATNTSTGSVSNTDVLQVGANSHLQLQAYNDVNLAGTVQVKSGSTYTATSAAHPLNWLRIYAGDYDGSVLSTDGVATLSTDITTSNGANVYGNQVKLLSNLSSLGNSIYIVAGAQSATDYAVRVASGKTVTADSIYVDGDTAGDNPNVILQGTLAANYIKFGRSSAVSDVFTGPTGSLSMSGSPTLYFNATGRVKTVPYNNAPNNFRFNGLAVNVTDGSPLTLVIDPLNAQGTPLSGLNLLVNSSVNLQGGGVATVSSGSSVLTGSVNKPNTHLVLQSSGNIATSGSFYWPGYVYLGNVAADTNGNALPGTLGFGTITLGGDFNNVLPGDIAGASGIHFITQFLLNMNGHNVITNANAWVNFGTGPVTQAYASDLQGSGQFFGGTQAGTVVNYGVLDASNFVTQVPSATP